MEKRLLSRGSVVILMVIQVSGVVVAGLEIAVSFETLVCSSCARVREAGDACPCGVEPDSQADINALFRRQAAATALALLDEAPAQDGSRPFGGPEEVGRFAGWAEQWLDTFFEATAAVALNTPQGMTDLHREVRSLVTERARLGSVARRRPWIQLIDAAQDGAGLLSDMARSCLSALAARTPTEAEQSANDAQRHVDAFVERFSACTAVLQRMDEFVQQTTPAEQFSHLLAQEMTSRAVHDLPELMQHTDAEIGSLVEAMPAPNFGVGLQFALYESALSVCGDPHRFRQVVKDSHSVLHRTPPDWRALPQTPTLGVPVSFENAYRSAP
jgi:signal transduction histidine kinase